MTFRDALTVGDLPGGCAERRSSQSPQLHLSRGFQTLPLELILDQQERGDLLHELPTHKLRHRDSLLLERFATGKPLPSCFTQQCAKPPPAQLWRRAWVARDALFQVRSTSRQIRHARNIGFRGVYSIMIADRSWARGVSIIHCQDGSSCLGLQERPRTRTAQLGTTRWRRRRQRKSLPRTPLSRRCRR